MDSNRDVGLAVGIPMVTQAEEVVRARCVPNAPPPREVTDEAVRPVSSRSYRRRQGSGPAGKGACREPDREERPTPIRASAPGLRRVARAGLVGVMSVSQHDRCAFEAIVVGLCREDPLLVARASRAWTRRVRLLRAAGALSCAAGLVVLALTSTDFVAALAATVLTAAGLAFSIGASVSQPVPLRARLLDAHLRARAWCRHNPKRPT